MELQRAIDRLLKWMHRYVSPVFLALLMASFILWYIAKLSYIYTTEQKAVSYTHLTLPTKLEV